MRLIGAADMGVKKAGNTGRVEVVTVRLPKHFPDPDDLLSFVESSVFTKAWKRCGLNDDDLRGLQVSITCYPKLGPVIEGTGGVRKARFSPTGGKVGKRGSHRALYCYFEEHDLVLLLTAYPKSKTDNISADGKAAMKKMVEYQSAILSKGPIS
jgi:hypothetical protein